MHIMRNLNTMILFSFTNGLSPEYEAKQIKVFYKELDAKARREKLNRIIKFLKNKTQ
jgi:hypothetical protein